MARKSAQSFSDSVDKSKFVIEEAPALKGSAEKISDATENVNYDWSKVNKNLSKLEGTRAVQTKRAAGEDLTADYWARRAQGEQSEQPRTLADLGKMMLANARSSSAAQAAQARLSQQEQEGKKAQALNNAIYTARMRMQQETLALENEKFKIQQTLNQSVQGLDLAQKAMLQDFYLTKATARTAAEAINIDSRRSQIESIFNYVQMGIGAAASATAAAAAARTPSTQPQSTGSARPVNQGFTSSGYAIGNAYGLLGRK